MNLIGQSYQQRWYYSLPTLYFRGGWTLYVLHPNARSYLFIMVATRARCNSSGGKISNTGCQYSRCRYFSTTTGQEENFREALENLEEEMDGVGFSHTSLVGGLWVAGTYSRWLLLVNSSVYSPNGNFTYFINEWMDLIHKRIKIVIPAIRILILRNILISGWMWFVLSVFAVEHFLMYRKYDEPDANFDIQVYFNLYVMYCYQFHGSCILETRF